MALIIILHIDHTTCQEVHCRDQLHDCLQNVPRNVPYDPLRRNGLLACKSQRVQCPNSCRDEEDACVRDLVKRTGRKETKNQKRPEDALGELDDCADQYHACRLARNGQTTAASTSVPRSMSEEEPSGNINCRNNGM